MGRRSGSKGASTAEAVQAAARRLIAQRGFAAVSMRDIAAEVGVQAGTIYLYTPDKQSLLLALMRDHLLALLAAWEAEAALAEAETAPQALERFVRFHVGYHISRPDEVFIAYMELRNLTEANFAEVEALRDGYESALRGLLARGVAEGQFTLPDLRLTARAIIAMLTGVTTWYRAGGRLSPAQVADHYADLVRRMTHAATP
ncbi:TetR/AcrR family transcriptional regulator [Paroceanicella profunda]|uniref:TetR/AcrR family transcriptional regulator n=1 Tax=Paroceanicella profunda TaxID=2579971 RepID=A0A5B8FYP5_9RHOB|nr:TetR/AcrR family transcriptional regulator [Paroceanicella profunda]QDL91692.1 TetR/AcrR family transcriptional regulator [Paroceanicella profunda]